MTSQLPAPGSFDLESVKVWYSCQKRGVDCSAWFYSVPALQKHFTEEHPSEELNLPEHLPKEVLQGQIIFWEDGQPRRQWPHKAYQIGATETEVSSSQPNKKHTDKGHPTSRKVNNPEATTVTKSCPTVSAAQDDRASLHKNSKTRKVMKMNHSFVLASAPLSPLQQILRYRIQFETSFSVCAYKCELCGTSTGLMDSLVKHLQHIHNVPVEDAKKMASQAGLKFLTTTKNLKLEEIDQTKINSTVM
ncbi:hypothetical protein Ocin01_14911 [Orchesella cincta]|uniref:C2H2-type domain-containing protein n=1 Tax=Orchesella cincta TaxID=48709 RepID=A0A1D2MFK9_ORCCI|nr:hypothetical protein Ocin01_14911 [Orchesella cincta]